MVCSKMKSCDTQTRLSTMISDSTWSKHEIRKLTKGDGMQQGIDYAATLNIPFVFSSNRDGFVLHDRTGQSAMIKTNLGLDAFPSPADLWARYRASKGLDAQAERMLLQDYFEDGGGGKAPRYHQVNAVNATIEAIANLLAGNGERVTETVRIEIGYRRAACATETPGARV